MTSTPRNAASKTPSQAPMEPIGGGKRLYQQVAEHLAEAIRNGEYPLGSRLAPERDLAERYGISRATVREAIIALEVGGMVEARGGSGVYVIGVQPEAPLPAGGPGPFEVLKARLLVEPEVAALAAQMAKPSDLEGLRELLQTLTCSLDTIQGHENVDRAFHVKLAEATGNSALVQMVADLRSQAKGEIWTHLQDRFDTPELRMQFMEDHRALFMALVEQDPRAARRIMRSHIQRVISAFVRCWQTPDATPSDGLP